MPVDIPCKHQDQTLIWNSTSIWNLFDHRQVVVLILGKKKIFWKFLWIFPLDFFTHSLHTDVCLQMIMCVIRCTEVTMFVTLILKKFSENERLTWFAEDLIKPQGRLYLWNLKLTYCITNTWSFQTMVKKKKKC